MSKKKKQEKDFKRKKADNDIIKNNTQPSFVILPDWRMYTDFPWQIWAVGWLAIFKAVIWLSTSPNCPDPMIKLLTIKFLICMVPLLILGIGVWNLRKWAVWGIILLCIADVAFFVIFQNASGCIMGNSFWLLAITLLLFNGPLGSMLILITTPYLLKHSGKNFLDVVNSSN
ncbi:MAG: hypothetical protein SWH54_05830 [Thermodesulfobacteriota bacterium]|nr:hypothetical protein [Thermodesulfobacteriota bacterium]